MESGPRLGGAPVLYSAGGVRALTDEIATLSPRLFASWLPTIVCGNSWMQSPQQRGYRLTLSVSRQTEKPRGDGISRAPYQQHRIGTLPEIWLRLREIWLRLAERDGYYRVSKRMCSTSRTWIAQVGLRRPAASVQPSQIDNA